MRQLKKHTLFFIAFPGIALGGAALALSDFHVFPNPRCRPVQINLPRRAKNPAVSSRKKMKSAEASGLRACKPYYAVLCIKKYRHIIPLPYPSPDVLARSVDPALDPPERWWYGWAPLWLTRMLFQPTRMPFWPIRKPFWPTGMSFSGQPECYSGRSESHAGQLGSHSGRPGCYSGGPECSLTAQDNILADQIAVPASQHAFWLKGQTDTLGDQTKT